MFCSWRNPTNFCLPPAMTGSCLTRAASKVFCFYFQVDKFCPQKYEFTSLELTLFWLTLIASNCGSQQFWGKPFFALFISYYTYNHRMAWEEP